MSCGCICACYTAMNFEIGDGMLPIGLFGSPLARVGVLALGAAVVLGAAYLTGRGHGRDACTQEHQATLAESLQRGLDQAQAIARQDAEVSEYYERTRVRIVAQEPKVIEVVKYAQTADAIPACHLSDAEFRLLNEARGYSPDQSADPGPHAGPVPPAAAHDIAAPQRREGTPLPNGPQLQRLRSTDGAARGCCDCPRNI